jgi:mannose-6-phosphate isomerase-like protein (cupin superfamily)
MVRRVVTGISESGKAVIVSDGEPPLSRRRVHVPGFADALVWRTAIPARPSAEPSEEPRSWVPDPGETIAMTVTFPPDSVYTDPGFDAASARAEQLRASPGLAELFEPDKPGMHTTPTVDYAVMLEGDVVLDLDAGETTLLHPGDVVVQNGTRHAWRNPGSSPATVFFVLIGAGESA